MDKQAFPMYRFDGSRIDLIDGMSLRDYFAGQAMAGDSLDGEGSWDNNVPQKYIVERARLYYRIADAMIKARNPEERPI